MQERSGKPEGIPYMGLFRNQLLKHGPAVRGAIS
jgi:hypothetical protein